MTVIKDEELTASFSIDPATTAVAAVIADLSARLPVIDITVREPEMDGIIREIYEAKVVTA